MVRVVTSPANQKAIRPKFKGNIDPESPNLSKIPQIRRLNFATSRVSLNSGALGPAGHRTSIPGLYQCRPLEGFGWYVYAVLWKNSGYKHSF